MPRLIQLSIAVETMTRRRVIALLASTWVAKCFATRPARTIDVAVDFGADPSGKINAVPAFQSATAALASGAARKLRIPAGTYQFDVTGDQDTIQVPSNCELECEPGVIFRWGYWGSPLFAIINRTNVTLALNGAKFLWTGNFGRTVGNRDVFGYGRAIPAYEWCCHVISMGSERVTIRDLACAGLTPANVQNAFIQVGGKADGSQTYGNVVMNVAADDVCQVLLFASQRRFLFQGLHAGRYSSVSAGLYGPGHVIYATHGDTPSDGGEIRDVVDRGIPSGPFTGGSLSVQLKNVANTRVRGLSGMRAEGVLSVRDCVNVDVELEHSCASSQSEDGTGIIYFIESVKENRGVKIRAKIEKNARRNFMAVNMAGTSTASKNVECELDLDIRTEGGEGAPLIWWVGSNGKARISLRTKDTSPPLLNIDRGSENNRFEVRVLDAGVTPRVWFGGKGVQRHNIIACGDESVLKVDRSRFSETDGDANQLLCRSTR